MFIKSANSRARTGYTGYTGYTGDVNTAFRQGRQDAFRDYIDNFNFARQADAANNAENQANVQRIADNYARQLNMNKDGRNEVLDFVQKSDQIDGAVLDADINSVTRAKLTPRVKEMGDYNAQVEFFKGASGANEAKTAYTDSVYKAENADLAGKKYVTGLERSVAENQLGTGKAVDESKGRQYLQSEMENFYKPEMQKQLQQEHLATVIAIAKQNGDTRSDAEIGQAILNSPEYQTKLQEFMQDKFSSIVANYEALMGNASGAMQAVGGNVPTNGKTKSTQTKEQDKNNWKPGATKYIDGDKATGLVESSVDLGNGFKLSPDGSILKVLPDERVMVMTYSRGDGKRLTVDEATRLANGMPGAKTGNVTAEQIGKSLD